MKFAKGIFSVSFSIFLLLGVIPHAVSQNNAPELQTVLYGSQEDANTRIPPPPLAKRPSRGRGTRTVQSQFVVTYTGFTSEARAAFQYAVDIWSSFIRSPVPIRINAIYRNIGTIFGVPPLGGTDSIGRSIPTSQEFWYPSALANKIAGLDLDIFNSDFTIILNSNAATNWYFGTDGNTPSGQFDFVTLALHEIAHGLGFTSSVDVEGDEGSVRSGNPSYPEIYDSFVVNGSSTKITSFDDPSAELRTQFTSDNLFSDGTEGKAANSGTCPKLHVPRSWAGGSSYIHLDEETYPEGDVNSLMTPFISRAESIHHPGPILLGMLEDMGWTINTPPEFVTDTATRSIAENTAAGMNIGTAVSGTDEDKSDTLTYSLRGTDAASFTIEDSTGQLKTSAALNYEVKDTYTVTVAVDDGVAEDTIEVTINVTDVNDPPRFPTDSATREVLEGTSANQNIGAPLVATDEDSSDALTYSLGGTDAGSFSIGQGTGQLKTKSALDYDTQSTYEITVIATGNGNLKGSISVTINVYKVVDFTDTALASAVRSALGIASDASILSNALPSLTSLSVTSASISDLTGLEYATGLTSLNLSGNDIVNLSSLADMVNLVTLNLSDNEIVDLQYLTDLSSLTTLDLSDNSITDVSPLSGLTNLITLDLSGNTGITNPEELYNLEQGGTSITLPPGIEIPDAVTFPDDNLETAIKSALGIVSDDPILETDITTLTSLTATNKGIVNLTGLEKATGLTSLTLSDNAIVNLSPLSKLSNLETLDLLDNEIVDLRYLKDLSSLTTLDLSENEIVNLSHLSGLSSLETLDLSDNLITDVSPLRGLSSLTTLDLGGNTDITNPEELYDLEQGGTSITLPPGIEIPDVVAFTDDNLETAVKSALGIAIDDPVLETDITTLSSLTATNKGIVNLTGLEEATGLTSLNLNNNSIVNLSPLSGLTSLTRLDLAYNQIEDVSALRNLTSLTRLDLDNNQIESVSALSGLGSLRRLELRNNDVMDATPLSTMTHLTHLYLNGNDNLTNIKSLVKLTDTTIDIDLPEPVNVPDTNLASALRTALSIPSGDSIFPEDMETLTTFSASDESIVTLTGLQTATELTSLTLSDNAIVNLSPLSKLSNIETLNLLDNEIVDLRYLKDLSGLTTLNLAENKIVNLSHLSGLSSLETLNLSGNLITDVSPLSGLTSLTTLDLSGNTGITNPEELYDLEQGGTSITLPPGIEIPDAVVFTDNNLETAVKSALGIAIDDPVLETDIATLTSLTATNKRIVNLTGLEEATGLTSLNLSNNSIVNLSPLSGLTSLTRLDLDNNQIEDVSALSGLGSLKRLELRNNNIMDVTSLSTMTHLTHLYLDGNDNLTNIKRLLKLTSTTVDIDLPDPVEIPDTNLASALRTTLGFLSDDPILPEEMEGLTNLTASGRSIADLTGLEAATELTNLTLSNNSVEDLSPLEDLTNLETLDLRNNQITDVAPLAELSNLTLLQLGGNSVTNPGALYRLKRDGTTITGIDVPDNVVFDDPNLEAAVKSALRIATVDPILPDTLATLTRLTASNKEITSLRGLEDAGLLATLDVGQNKLSDLTPLTGLTNLEVLDLADNEITNVAVLSGLSNLRTLDLRRNNVGSITPFSTMTHLRYLYLSGNSAVTSLSGTALRTLVKLKELGTSIDITLPSTVNIPDVNLKAALRSALNLQTDDPIFPEDMETLTTFNATGQSIVTLTGLGAATDLTNLTLSNNQIVSLSPLSRLTSLETLDLSNNAIRGISPLSGLINLTRLNLSGNQITSVGSLSRLVSLTSLDLSDNQISYLSPLSDLTNLTDLNLSNNRITNVLPLQSLSSLQTLNLFGNDDLTQEKASVLYKLAQVGTTITLPTGITLPSPSNIVVFNNAALEAAVRSRLGISAGYPILLTGAKGIDKLMSLTATYKQIDNLTGLERATNLTTLDLGNNEIVNLSPLSRLTSLGTLDLADNEIENLSPLRNLTNLTSLDLDDNEIEDVSALSGLTNLKTLDLRSNDVMDVAPLKDLTSLTYIYLSGNENLENLEWLGALENLRSDIRLPDVVQIPDTNLDSTVRTALRTVGHTVSNDLPMSERLLESLETLTASNRGISDLTGCEHMTGLTSLDLRNNQIMNVPPLSRLYALETLLLTGNPILDTSVLRELERRGTSIDITIYRYPFWDVNQDGNVNETDLFLITLTITGESPDVNGDGSVDAEDRTAADANKDGNVDNNDLLFVFEKQDRPVNLGAPLLSADLDWKLLEKINVDQLRVQLDILRSTNDGTSQHQRAIAFFEAILAVIQPNQTLLLPNYPNPMNPETWIPYQLARGSAVRITIYDARGAVIRRLELGYRTAGYYRVRSRAAHWNGKNSVGERVVSGIYFYQLETDNVSLLRKMVILK